MIFDFNFEEYGFDSSNFIEFLLVNFDSEDNNVTNKRVACATQCTPVHFKQFYRDSLITKH